MEQVEGKTDETNGIEAAAALQKAIQTPVIQNPASAVVVVAKPPKQEPKNGKELQAAAAAAAASVIDDDDDDDCINGNSIMGSARKSANRDDRMMPPSKRFKKFESDETSTTSEEGGPEGTTPSGKRLRKFNRIPVFIVDYHNDVLEFIYRCLATRHLPLENNVLVHFDSHPDMVISREIPASASYDKETMLAELSIENWIMPTVFAGHINRVVWMKNAWCQQMPTGKYRFKVGQKDDKINVDIPLDYFISEGNYCDSAELKDARDVELHVINADRASDVGVEQLLTKDDAPNFILDIDLDFFSTSNPFLEIYKDAQCYRRLTEIFRYENVSPIKVDDENGLKGKEDGTEIGAKATEESKEEDPKNGSEGKEDSKADDPKNGSADKQEEPKNGSAEKEDAKQEEPKNGSAEKEDAKQEEPKNGSAEKEDAKQEEPKNGSAEKEDAKQEDPKNGSAEKDESAKKPIDALDVATEASSSPKPAGVSKSSDGFVINAGLDSQVYIGNTQRRKQQLEALKRIFEHLEEVRSFEGLDEPDPEIVSADTFAKIKELLTVLQRHYGDEEIDWLLIYDSGSTTDSMGLPHHISTPDEVKVYMESFRQFLKRLPVQPVIITIACSAEDDYCPKDQVAVIQEEVLTVLNEVYGDRLNPKPILHYLEDEWDVMQL